jgi:mono/diheme cytochrome c family protein
MAWYRSANVVLLSLAWLTAATATATAAEAESLEDSGRTIYRTAIGVDGATIPAIVQGDVSLPAVAAACSNCHRRSGYGISEGGSRSLNLTAKTLFNEQTKPPVRPAYDDETLIRAIAGGISADGRRLHANMPRYQLSAENAAALLAYLKTLGTSGSRGISENDLSIATVIADDGPAAEREAIERVMRRYVEQKNAQTRRESERAAAANRHLYGRSRQRAYRNWRLHEWRLSGPASTWPRQLEALYQRDQPFAIVSGTAGNDWPTVHAFCEQAELPCILPLSQPPEDPDSYFYSLYFSAGPALDSAVIASHIKASRRATGKKIVVVHADSELSQAVLRSLQEDLDGKHGYVIDPLVSKKKSGPSQRQWRALLGKDDADAVVIGLLPATSLHNLSELITDNEDLLSHLYTSELFTDWAHGEDGLSHALLDVVHHVYPYTLPGATGAQFPREYLWFKQNEMLDLDAVLAAKVLYACRVLGVGLADIESNFSGEYFIESLEHALDGTQLTSLFPRTSIGPAQRVLTRGAYVVGVSATPGNTYVNPVWIQP